MRVSRELSLKVQYVLDELAPPRLRDARWFMWLPMRLVFREYTEDFMTFKDGVFEMTDRGFAGLYRKVASVNELQGDTDLNDRCVAEILRSLQGRNVLEVGSGRGYLAARMAETHHVTACDIVIAESLRAHAAITCVEASIERLPFDDGQFDTVVCTHTLEHVQHLPRAVEELRRVARRRLIVVVPRQRPYRYTFSLHVNFFPYAWSLTGQLGHVPGAVIKNLGDWFYLEDVTQRSDPNVVVGAIGQRYSPSGLPSISSSGSRVISSSAPSGS